jgi:hypothetical protein
MVTAYLFGDEGLKTYRNTRWGSRVCRRKGNLVHGRQTGLKRIDQDFFWVREKRLEDMGDCFMVVIGRQQIRCLQSF